jgi:hypothetical protein
MQNFPLTPASSNGITKLSELSLGTNSSQVKFAHVWHGESPRRSEGNLKPSEGLKHFCEKYSITFDATDSNVRIAKKRAVGESATSCGVRLKTKEYLDIAHNQIWKTKSLVKHVGNIVSDIVHTDGESWARNSLRQNLEPEKLCFNDENLRMRAKIAAETAGSNCDTLAALSFTDLARSNLDAPIQFVFAYGTRPENHQETVHTFMVVGDPREVGRANAVVVDPWPTYPTAYTLDKTKFSSLEPSYSHSPRTPFPLPYQTCALPAWKINDYLSKEGKPHIGKELIACVLGTSVKPIVQQLFTTSDPDATYYTIDGNGGNTSLGHSYNALPVQYWNETQRGLKKTEEFKMTHPNLFSQHVRYDAVDGADL